MANIEEMGLTTPIIVVYGLPVGFKEPTGTLKCGRAGRASRPPLPDYDIMCHIIVHIITMISSYAWYELWYYQLVHHDDIVVFIIPKILLV